MQSGKLTGNSIWGCVEIPDFPVSVGDLFHLFSFALWVLGKVILPKIILLQGDIVIVVRMGVHSDSVDILQVLEKELLIRNGKNEALHLETKLLAI